MAKKSTKTIDERFDEVTEAFLDQRDFTIVCFDKLRAELRHEIMASEGRLSHRLDRHELVLSEILNEVKVLSRATSPDPRA